MSNTIFITANWTTGALSQQTISRQYDNNRYAVQFIGYPEGDGTEELDLYLLVWMSTAPGQKPGEITPIQLNSDQWYISNYFTQQVQVIKFQLCVLNEAGTYEAHSPIFSGRIGDSLEHNGTSHDIDVSTLFDAYREYVEELIIGAGAVIIDPTPTQGSANAVSSGGVWDALRDTDDTLTQARQAADAEVTGKIAKALFDVTDEVSPVFLELGSINTSTGADSSSNDGTRLRSNYIKVPENQTVYELKNGTSSAITVYIVYYDANKGFLQAKTATGADAGESLIGGISTVTNAVYIRFRFAGTGMSTSNVDLSVKLSAGGTMHSYPAITSGLDMDTDFNKSGTWLVTSAKNIPANYPSTTTGKIVVFGANNATTVGRLQFVFDKNGNIFQRQSFVNGTWSTWKSVITSFELNDFK